jgi:hypothetical protein
MGTKLALDQMPVAAGKWADPVRHQQRQIGLFQSFFSLHFFPFFTAKRGRHILVLGEPVRPSSNRFALIVNWLVL